uniref:DNA transposition protein, AAA+ family ATPase n=1 Tax=Candidatus Kentrum sp. UNK TaxID=2126344 RepID=A0A451AQP3_9GAMM|nr:MAG: hypothetical protein BECKUNK1418G_GA0071005_100258 [Candidatus Kentron sp. UNK]VFK68329.1 MAG: hypothetical protein BECKUNK1418H_GA0071006_100158 [Candidatus Kentron sp. UNK]
MTEKLYNAKLQEKIKELLAGGLNQAAVSSRVGISPAVLSQWLDSKYPGDVPGVEEKITRWLASQEKKAEYAVPVLPAFVETDTAKRIISAIFSAHVNRDISLIHGGAGLGKSVCARQYREETPNVYLVTMTPTVNSTVACLERIAMTLGLRVGNERAARIEAVIVEKLMGSEGLLIIDEAQHLSMPALETIRSIHDATEIGLVLMGNEIIYTRVTGGTRASEFAQLFSRIGMRVSLRQPTQEDVRMLIRATELPREKAIFDVLLRIARKPGALRGMKKVIRNATLIAREKMQPITADLIHDLWRNLTGEEGERHHYAPVISLVSGIR